MMFMSLPTCLHQASAVTFSPDSSGEKTPMALQGGESQQETTFTPQTSMRTYNFHDTTNNREQANISPEEK